MIRECRPEQYLSLICECAVRHVTIAYSSFCSSALAIAGIARVSDADCASWLAACCTSIERDMDTGSGRMTHVSDGAFNSCPAMALLATANSSRVKEITAKRNNPDVRKWKASFGRWTAISPGDTSTPLTWMEPCFLSE